MAKILEQIKRHCVLYGVFEPELIQYFLEKDILIHVHKTWCNNWKFRITHRNGLDEGYYKSEKDATSKSILRAYEILKSQ